jgi:hypothetical protein
VTLLDAAFRSSDNFFVLRLRQAADYVEEGFFET